MHSNQRAALCRWTIFGPSSNADNRIQRGDTRHQSSYPYSARQFSPAAGIYAQGHPYILPSIDTVQPVKPPKRRLESGHAYRPNNSRCGQKSSEERCHAASSHSAYINTHPSEPRMMYDNNTKSSKWGENSCFAHPETVRTAVDSAIFDMELCAGECCIIGVSPMRENSKREIIQFAGPGWVQIQSLTDVDTMPPPLVHSGFKGCARVQMELPGNRAFRILGVYGQLPSLEIGGSEGRMTLDITKIRSLPL